MKLTTPPPPRSFLFAALTIEVTARAVIEAAQGRSLELRSRMAGVFEHLGPRDGVGGFVEVGDV